MVRRPACGAADGRAHPLTAARNYFKRPSVSAKVLSARLKELESIGILERNVQPTSPPSVEYELTSLGRELIPAIEAIASVGKRLKRVQPQVEASNRPTPAMTSAIPRSSRAVAR